jgi:hypothetical protein
VSPLLYEDILGDKAKNGSIDVANPTDAPITVDVSVQGFKQVGSAGDMEFFDNPDLIEGIRTDLKSFDIGARERVRVLFTVDPAKLPQGGVFGAIFFKTRPSEKAGSNSSFVAQSANVGTLIVLRNHGNASTQGGIAGLNLPFWQFGGGLRGTVMIENTSPTKGGVAFRPGLESQVLPWGSSVVHDSGLILPSNHREFAIVRPGSFFGLLPFQVRDISTGTDRTVWVFATTGWFGWLLLVLALALVIGLIYRFRGRFRGLRRSPRPKPAPVPAAMATSVPMQRPEPVWATAEPERAVEPEPVTVEPKPEREAEREAEPEPEAAPEPEPVPVVAVDPELTKPVVAAEAAAPDPGTLIQPRTRLHPSDDRREKKTSEDEKPVFAHHIKPATPRHHDKPAEPEHKPTRHLKPARSIKVVAPATPHHIKPTEHHEAPKHHVQANQYQITKHHEQPRHHETHHAEHHGPKPSHPLEPLFDEPEPKKVERNSAKKPHRRQLG